MKLEIFCFVVGDGYKDDNDLSSLRKEVESGKYYQICSFTKYLVPC